MQVYESLLNKHNAGWHSKKFNFGNVNITFRSCLLIIIYLRMKLWCKLLWSLLCAQQPYSVIILVRNSPGSSSHAACCKIYGCVNSQSGLRELSFQHVRSIWTIKVEKHVVLRASDDRNLIILVATSWPGVAVSRNAIYCFAYFHFIPLVADLLWGGGLVRDTIILVPLQYTGQKIFHGAIIQIFGHLTSGSSQS